MSDDPLRRGALRHIEAAQILHAVTSITEGLVVPLNLPLTTHSPHRPAPVYRMLEHQALRRMGDGRYAVVNDDALDFALQGSTHWDAVGHFGVLEAASPDVYYGGFPLSETRVAGPASNLGIDELARGIVGRGVVLDLVAALTREGDEWLQGDVRVNRSDIERCLEMQQVELRAGDVVCLYTGFESLLASTGGRFPSSIAGIDATTVPLWLEAEIAGLVSDNTGVEAVPADYAVHAQLLRDAGVPLGELWALAELVRTARRLGRWEFLLVSVPLNVPGAYGAPANAVAVF